MSNLHGSNSRRRSLMVTIVLLSAWTQLSAQPQSRHYLYDSRMPTGEIGRSKTARRPELNGFFQPVAITVPEGSSVAVAEGAGFYLAEITRSLVGLQVGEVYRLEVANIPNRLGRVYPTIELIDRLHPPPGKETRYPIPIDIAEEDIALALAGKFVTRVIYVENPMDALPARDLPQQRYLEVMGHEDPLHVAEELGRPVAILRLGTLAPGVNGPSAAFLFGSPPIQRHAQPPERPYVPSDLKPGDVATPRPKVETLPDAPALPDVDDEPTVEPADEPVASPTPTEPIAPATEPEQAEEENPFGDDTLFDEDAPADAVDPFENL